MGSFKVDLGLDRYRADDKEFGNYDYLTGGIKIQADEYALTDFDYKGKNEKKEEGFLGTHIDIIWKNLARNASKLSEEDEISFYITTEGWDPEFKVRKKDDEKLEISMTKKSAKWSSEIIVPDEYIEGIEIEAHDFFKAIADAGRTLKEFYKDRDTESPHISDLDKRIKEIEHCKKNYEN